MLEIQSSKFEDYLADRYPAIKQLPSEVHDSVIGWHCEHRRNYLMQLEFRFGIVKITSNAGGVAMYELLAALIEGLDSVMESAVLDILRSSEMSPDDLVMDISKWGIDKISLEDRESIKKDTYPSKFYLYPSDGICQIIIQNKVGYWSSCDLERCEYGEVCCALRGGRIVYERWGFTN